MLGIEVLESWGLEVVVGDAVHGRETGYFAAPDADRLHDLVTAFADSSVRAVFTTRGGFGATRIAEAFARRIERTDPIWLVGFSDVTALHRAVWTTCRWQSAHGATVETLGRAGTDSIAATTMHELLFTESYQPTFSSTERTASRIDGILEGGNLSLIASLCGTALGAFDHDAVLFIEDVRERPYRVDRLLTQVLAQSAASSLRAVVAGGFTDCAEPNTEWPSFSIEEVLRDHNARVPMFTGLPCGHLGAGNVAIPLGAPVTIEGTDVRIG